MAKIAKVRGKQESLKSLRDLKVENYKGRRANGKFAKVSGIPTSGQDLGSESPRLRETSRRSSRRRVPEDGTLLRAYERGQRSFFRRRKGTVAAAVATTKEDAKAKEEERKKEKEEDEDENEEVGEEGE
ncbi:hypothetical protein V1478_016604 [Vespula squamosa]|uniref:Uncharacterized protein n=1 Tax=Vespula squamosa TaxID=30214 RepID=A0ABD2A088_VESSQ